MLKNYERVIALRMTEADVARLKGHAEAEGRTVSQWCRRYLMAVVEELDREANGKVRAVGGVKGRD